MQHIFTPLVQFLAKFHSQVNGQKHCGEHKNGKWLKCGQSKSSNISSKLTNFIHSLKKLLFKIIYEVVTSTTPFYETYMFICLCITFDGIRCEIPNFENLFDIFQMKLITYDFGNRNMHRNINSILTIISNMDYILHFKKYTLISN